MRNTINKEGKEYQLSLRAYNNLTDMNLDIPKRFRKEGSIEYYNEETKKWHIATPQ